MSIITFTIKHDRKLDGPFPLEQMGQVSNVICHVEDIDEEYQKIDIVVNNAKNEDMHAVCFELGRLVNASSQVYKNFVNNGLAN